MNTPRFDDEGFGTANARVSYSDLVAVGIRTTADGPFAEDVFWQFLLRDGAVELPGRMIEFDALTTRLPGIDFGKVIKAVGSCDERIFRVWHHEESRNRPNDAALRTRFVQLVERHGAKTATEETFARLHAAYSAESRRYHDVEHLTDCLREVDALPASRGRDLVELSLWYHDAVYEAGAVDSEHRSADWLLGDAATLGLDEPFARSAAALVEATNHSADRQASTEAALVADIDLAILGRDPLRFMEFEYGVAEEFHAVRQTAFIVGRGRLLAGLLREPIYQTPPFQKRFETNARANISGLLASRRYAAYRYLGWLPWRRHAPAK